MEQSNFARVGFECLGIVINNFVGSIVAKVRCWQKRMLAIRRYYLHYSPPGLLLVLVYLKTISGASFYRVAGPQDRYYQVVVQFRYAWLEEFLAEHRVVDTVEVLSGACGQSAYSAQLPHRQE